MYKVERQSRVTKQLERDKKKKDDEKERTEFIDKYLKNLRECEEISVETYNNECVKFTRSFLDKLLDSYGLKLNTLYSIVSHIVNKNPDLVLTMLEKEPDKFITLSDNLLTFKKFEWICKFEFYKFSGLYMQSKWLISKFKSDNYILLEDPTKFKKEYKYPLKYEWEDFYNKNPEYPKEINLNKLSKITGEEFIIDEEISKLCNRNEKYITTINIIEKEKECTDAFYDMFIDNNTCNISQNTINQYIEDYEEEKGIELNKDQKKYVYTTCNSKFAILNGGPGTGKSTATDCALHVKTELFNDVDNNSTYILTPTGKSLKSLKSKIKDRKINEENQVTIHKFLYCTNRNLRYYKSYNGSSMLDYLLTDITNKRYKQLKNFKDQKYPKLIIIDEAGMIDFHIFSRLVLLCKKYYPDTNLWLIGDTDQLPPINTGTPFKEIIKFLNKYDEENVMTTLIETKRTSGNIDKLIKLVKKGRTTPEKLEKYIGDNVEFIDCKFDNKNEIISIIKTIQSDEINKIIKENNISEIKAKNILSNLQQYISAEHDKIGGSNQINEFFQNNTKRKKDNSGENIYYKDLTNKMFIGDKIVRIKNCYNKGYVNGDQAKLCQYNSGKYLVKYDDNTEEEGSKSWLEENFEPFYCSTVHKMQGSEQDIIICILNHNMYTFSINNEKRKSLLYTAISRAKKKLIIIGDKNKFIKIANDSRQSNDLSYFMKDGIELKF